MSKILIGFTGKAGAGKDTAAEYLLHNLGFWTVAFADPMRSMMEALLEPAGLSEYMKSRQMKEVTIPEIGVSYRRMMQTLGTEWGRGLDEDFWVRIALAKIDHRPHIERWSITDVRFPNEAKAIKARGGVLVHIDRPGLAPVEAHESEAWAGKLGEDHVIVNDGSIKDFHSRVDHLATKLIKESK